MNVWIPLTATHEPILKQNARLWDGQMAPADPGNHGDGEAAQTCWRGSILSGRALIMQRYGRLGLRERTGQACVLRIIRSF